MRFIKIADLGDFELFDLAKDPNETTNVARGHPEKLAEILTILARKRGWKPEQVRAFVEREISLGSRFKQTFEDEAAALEFAPVDADVFVRLKEAALDLIGR